MIPEHIWEKARKNQLFRERRRLTRLGRINPYSVPIVMEKIDGIWKLPRLAR